MAGRLVQAGAGPALVRFAYAGLADGPHSVAGRVVQVWRRAGASQVGSRTISRLFHSVERRLVQAGAGRGRPLLVRCAHARSAGGPHSVAGRLVQAGAGPALVRFAYAGSAGGPTLWQDSWSRSGSDW